MRAKKLLTALSSCLLLVSTLGCPVTAFAEVALPPGAVKGLPERLAALDSEGNAVNSATGEYFFHVENMKYAEVYTKSVQLMNLREDYAYHIYFYVEPLYKKGSIDLEKGCECVFRLDDKEFYRGTVTGDGNFDLTQEYYDCGLYYPGDSHVLSCSIVWNDLEVLDDINVDNGHRLVDQDGTHVLVGPDDSGHVEGEIEFKWIFAAQVGDGDSWEETQQTTPATSDDDSFDTGVTTTAGSDKSTDETVSSSTNQDVGTDTTIGSNIQNSSSVHETTSTTVTTVVQPGDPGNPDHPDGGSPDSPFTGYRAKNGTVWIVGMGVTALGILVMLVLMLREKRKQKKS